MYLYICVLACLCSDLFICQACVHIRIDNNQCNNSEIEKLISLGVISNYIDKHNIKIFCRILTQNGEKWVHHILNKNPQQC